MTDGEAPVTPRRTDVRVHRKSAGNLAALATIQVGNALLPLVAYPLVLGVVGTDRFSRIAVTESVMMTMQAVIIFSFDIEGVSRAVSVRHDMEQVSRVYSEILVTRAALLAAVVLGIVLVSPLLAMHTTGMMLAWMLVPFAYILQAAWFFQAMELNVAPAIVVLATRVACLLALRSMIHDEDAYLLVPLIVGATYAVGGLTLLGYVMSRHGLRLQRVSRKRIQEMLVHGREIFFGNVSVALYRDSNVLILSMFSSSAAVSTYAIAEKMVKVFQAGARPLNQLFFPKLVHALREEHVPTPRVRRIVSQFTWPQVTLLALGVCSLVGGYALFKDRLPPIFGSADGREITRLVSLMTVSVFVGVANFMFGSVGLNYLGQRRYLARAIFITGVSSVCFCVLMTHWFDATGAALGFVLAELLLFIQIIRKYA